MQRDVSRNSQIVRIYLRPITLKQPRLKTQLQWMLEDIFKVNVGSAHYINMYEVQLK